MAAKIKDGLFIGDEETSQSEIFINDNKISNLINLSGREVPNVWASHGLVYLTYNWEDRPDYRLFSGHEDSILTDIIEFVDVSIAHGISVLMFSKKGTGRAAVAACLYLMVKYRWGFEKSYDYVYSKKPDIDLNKGFIQQMFALDMKLVASRQKAYALKHGIENTFKIEPNMTINDIAAMLPSTEAKRWNSWDPSYVLTPNSTTTDSRPVTQDNIEEVVTWQKYAEPVMSALRKKDQIVVKVMLNKTKGNLRALDDAEEELVLIFSFINAKNTISTLPGPYYNAYEVQKQFTLRFDSVVFEEDVNWFPTSPSSSRYTYAPKGILKGVQRPLLTAASKQPSTSDMSQHKPISNNNNSNTGSTSGARDDKHTMSPPHVGLANPRNSIEIRSTKTNTAPPPVADDDLLKYVGISSAAQSKDDGNNGHYSSNNNAAASSNVAPPKRTTPASAAYEDKSANPPANAAEYDRKPMTAEERLRKLMADMERQKPANTSSTASSARSGNSNSNTGGTRGSSNNAVNDNNAGGGAPSLYDLANMQVHASSATAAPANAAGGRGGPTGPAGYGTASGRGASHSNQDFAMEDFDEDDDLDDPLAAFDVPTSHAASNRGGSSSTATGPSSTSAGGKTGALRARHDILANTTSGTGSTSRTGTNSMPAGGRSSSLNNTTGGSRPQAWGTSSSGGVSNRYASPSSVRSSGTNNVPSSNSSIASQGSDARVGSGGGSGGAYVGSGTTSGTQVYRYVFLSHCHCRCRCVYLMSGYCCCCCSHGSPAPNNRPATGGGLSSSGARRSTTGTTTGSGGRGASSSNNSVGSMGSNGLNGVYGTGLGGSSGPSGRFSPAPSPSTA